MQEHDPQQGLAKRLGKQHAKRMARQQEDHGKLTYWSAKRPLDIFTKQHSLIRGLLKLSLLWNRGRRNAADLQVVHNRVCVPGLPAGLEGYRILHLSDMHYECDIDLTGILVEAVRGLEYDLAVCTGDFRFGTNGPHTVAIRETKRVVEVLKAPLYVVLGNHDPVEMVPDLEALGDVTVLLNEAVVVEHRGERLFVIGIDDPHHHETHDLDVAMARISGEGPKVLLSHTAELYREAETRGIDLILSGHTHGGQLCFPGGFAVINHAGAPRRFIAGAWQHGSLAGYTSRGSGCTGLPVRYNCPPEVTVHELQGA